MLKAKYNQDKNIVDDEAYSKAVESLYELAVGDCGGSKCAVEVLLSLYDGRRWRVDLAGVCCSLDGDYFRQVLVAMKGRSYLMKEPHEVLTDGSKRFAALVEKCTGTHIDRSGGV